MRYLLLLPLLGLAVSGCDSSNPMVPAAQNQLRSAWSGTYSNNVVSSGVVLDVVQTGSVLTGEMVVGVPGSRHLWIRGMAKADSMILGDDPAHPTTPAAGLAMRVRRLPGGQLSGTLVLPSSGLDGTVSCDSLARREVGSDEVHHVAKPVIAIAYDGSHLWLSTVGDDYLLMDPDGTMAGSVTVLREPGVHWTSSVLMFDGSKIWGTFPITIMGPGGPSNVADLLAFDANGRRPDSLRVSHRPHGLAFEGTRAVSLRDNPVALIPISDTGAPLDSIPLGVPDAVLLGYDGAHFLAVGWLMRRLYEVNLDGNLVSICELPTATAGSLPSGLAVEGDHVWYAEGSVGAATLHRMTIR